MSNSIPQGWSRSNVDKTCDVLDSKRVPVNSEERSNRKGHYPYYGANGIQGFIDDFIFEGEHILLAEDGGNFDQWESRPISYLVSGKFWVNNHAHILKAKNGNETRFLHYSLVHKNITKHINGGTRAKLNQSDMRDIELALPPLPEQQKIAAILTSVDDVIESTQAQINKLKDLKTGMMQELLTKGIGHTEFKDSAVGRIPKAWEVLTIGEIVESMDGGVSVNGENRPKRGNEYGVLKVSAVIKGKFRPNENKAIISSDVHRAKLNPLAGHVLFSRANTPELVGECGYVEETRKDLFLPDKLWMIKLNSSKYIDARWLSYVLSSGQTRERISEAGTGTSGSMKNISKPNLLSIKIGVPPEDEQRKISSFLLAVDKRIECCTERLGCSANIKKALMQDLLTGKVQV